MHALLAHCGIGRPRASYSQQQQSHRRLYATTLLVAASVVTLLVLTPSASGQNQTVRLLDGEWPPNAFRINAGSFRHFWFSRSLQKRDRTGGLAYLFDSPRLERRDSYSTELAFEASVSDSHKAELVRRQSETQQGDVYLTVLTCVAPKPKSEAVVPQLAVYYSENIETPGPGDGGESLEMTDGLAQKQLSNIEQLYVGVFAPEDVSGNYTFQIVASSHGSMYSYMDNAGLRLDDTDNEHALVTTLVNFTNPPDVEMFQRSYQVHVIQADVLTGLNRSICAVTSRVTNEFAKEAAELNSTTRGEGNGWRVSAYFDELSGDTDYAAYLSERKDNSSVKVWQPTFLRTKQDENCRIIHGLETCDKVAYAVPAKASLSTDSVRNFYDTSARDRYNNFTNTLLQFSCARSEYSFVRNCSDCLATYKDWLCAVTIPRCTSGTLDNGLLRNNGSRNPDVDVKMNPGPYREVLPCIDLCYHVVQSCPPFLQFTCPKTTLFDSYALMASDGSARNATGVTCNAMDLDFVARSMGESAFGLLRLVLVWTWNLTVMCIIHVLGSL